MKRFTAKIIKLFLAWFLFFFSFWLLWEVDWRVALGVFIFVWANNLERQTK